MKPRICLTMSDYIMTHMQEIWTKTPQEEQIVGVLFLYIHNKTSSREKKTTCIIVNLSAEVLPNNVGMGQREHANTDANANKFYDQIKPRICLTISGYMMTHMQRIWTKTPQEEQIVGVLFL